jgi:hypothetical protein
LLPRPLVSPGAGLERRSSGHLATCSPPTSSLVEQHTVDMLNRLLRLRPVWLDQMQAAAVTVPPTATAILVTGVGRHADLAADDVHEWWA